MARSCVCDRWFARAASDIGFHSLPHVVQLVWFRLASAALDAEEKGHLRFPCSVAKAVAGMMNRSETEAGADLAELVDLGWMEMDADGRGFWMRGAKARNARAEAARINGLRGGAPRKGEGKEAARERRQGHLTLPIAGGRGETQETKTEPSHESSRAAAKPIATEEEAAAARETPTWVSLGTEIAAMAGLDPVRGGYNLAPVRGWLEAGVSPDLVRDVVRRCVARPTYRPGRPLQWFHNAVMEARDRAAPRDGLPEAATMDAYDIEVLHPWQANGCQGVPMRRSEWMATRRASA